MRPPSPAPVDTRTYGKTHTHTHFFLCLCSVGSKVSKGGVSSGRHHVMRSRRSSYVAEVRFGSGNMYFFPGSLVLEPRYMTFFFVGGRGIGHHLPVPGIALWIPCAKRSICPPFLSSVRSQLQSNREAYFFACWSFFCFLFRIGLLKKDLYYSYACHSLSIPSYGAVMRRLTHLAELVVSVVVSHTIWDQLKILYFDTTVL